MKRESFGSKKTISRSFDVRPRRPGNTDFGRAGHVMKEPVRTQAVPGKVYPPIFPEKKIDKEDPLIYAGRPADKFPKDYPIEQEEIFIEPEVGWRTRLLQKFILKRPFREDRRIGMGSIARRIFVFSSLAACSVLVFFSVRFVREGLEVKESGLVKGQEAISSLLSAKDSLKNGDYAKSYDEFSAAHQKLTEISDQLAGMGSFFVGATKFVPYLSKVSSANHLVSAADDISQVGVHITRFLEHIEELKKTTGEGETMSFLNLFKENEASLEEVARLLGSAQKNLEAVNAEDIPEANRDEFIQIKMTLPEVNQVLGKFLSEEKILIDLLGGNGPRKYLFLFQNNQEMRATGGFIGTYGLLDIFDGRVRNFFIDGIFNPDGQLRERIAPPSAIQKISANWSLHDSNWFPDFPRSANKAAWFYEKTGGPTVDGIITMTPTVMQKLLEITGPIEMPEYDVTVDSRNFIERIQFEVEIDYDKELNQPKKILADLAPKILDKLFNSRNVSDISRTLAVLIESLDEKHILIYSKNGAMQEIISAIGWSGEILDTAKDYLSVINTNVNGFKTDGIVEEKISHKAEIQPDGTIIDTLTITRYHAGGDSDFDWWNKVNSDYMRVYVPAGSVLLSAQGQTRELHVPPLDYDALGYKRDPDVQAEEAAIAIDEESGTRIYEEYGKTVFANWVYVSPKETVTLTYKYLLPFKINMSIKDPADTYSLLVQKQSGSVGSRLVTEVIFPSSYKILWRHPQEADRPESLSEGQNGMKVESQLNLDRFIGLTFSQ